MHYLASSLERLKKRKECQLSVQSSNQETHFVLQCVLSNVFGVDGIRRHDWDCSITIEHARKVSDRARFCDPVPSPAWESQYKR